MMYIVSLALVCAVLVLIVIVDFVLANITMFQTPFDVVLRVPFSSWTHTWEDVPFMYLVGGSFLLGILIIVLSVVIFDAKLKLKIRALRKEIRKLEKSVSDAKSMLPKQDTPLTKNPIVDIKNEEADITPEEVTKSFEDTIQGGNFYKESEFPESEEPQQKNYEVSSSIEDIKSVPQDNPSEKEVSETESDQRHTSENTTS